MRSNVRRDGPARLVRNLLLPVCALLTLLFGFAHARLLRTSGLTVDANRIEQRGILIPLREGGYRFLLETRDAEVLVDGRVVATGTPLAGSDPIRLDRRQHELVVRYRDGGANGRLTVLWAHDAGHFRPVPQLLLVPQRVPLREVDLRRVMNRLELAVPLLWLVIGGIAVLRLIRPWTSSAALKAALIAGIVLFTIGVWWGVPGPAGWPPDEIGPVDVRGGVQAGFAGGWTSIYPPVHHAAIALLYLPFEATLAAGIGDLEDVVWSGALLLAGRLLSILMALGIVWLAHRIAREHFGDRAAAFTAWTTLALLPLAYYAKTVNLDVPYVFWLTLSLLFFARLVTDRPRPSDFYLFTLFAVAAVCTKDQAYGFYVLPAIYLLMAGLLGPAALARGWPAVPSRRVLAVMAGIAVAGFALLHNLPFNMAGFAEHVRLIAGPASAGYAMFPNTLNGHARMAVASAWQLGQALSWPVLAIGVVAIGAAIRNRHSVLLWLLLPCLSYYLTFISVVRYHYDRFFLGIGVVLAVAASWWLDRWLTAPRGRTFKLAAIVIALTYALSRAVALDVMMLNDARYDVERWLRDHVAPGQHVAAIGHDALLPRASMSPWTPARLNPELLSQTRPEFLVVNVGFALRAEEGSAARETYALLDAGTTDYRRVARFRGKAIPPLSWERRFQLITDDPFTNLTKVNPTIDVYVRRDVMGVVR